jgi:Ca2+-binding RTX toxin-like protein
VVFGRDQTPFPAEFELSSLAAGDGTAGFVLNAIDGADRLGRSLSAAGDVNDDGIDDLLVSARAAAPGGRTAAGETYVVFGRDQTAFPAEFELSGLQTANGGDGSTGFVLNGIDVTDISGSSVSAAGDVNGDGIDDLLIGAHGADPDGRNYAGETYVVFGRPMDNIVVLCAGTEETMVGTEGDDFLVGTPGPDVIQAFGGNDTIQGKGGDDLICGDEGDDVIYGNGNNDRMFGDGGNDRLIGGGGRDFMQGGLGNDELSGRGGVDRLFGNEGDDSLFGEGGTDHLDGGAAFDRCDGGGSAFDTAAGCEQISNVP